MSHVPIPLADLIFREPEHELTRAKKLNDLLTHVRAIEAELTALAAEDVPFTPSGSIAATDVQAAIAELDSETQTALGGKQPLDGTLTALAGASWSAGSQVLTLSAADTVTLVTVGQAAGNILNKAAGDVLYQPLHANLTAFAGLSLVADRLPYANGTGTLALATFTAAGRALVDDADNTAQRATLGLGTAAVKNTGTSGDAVPLLNAANTWSASQTITKSFSASQAFLTINDGRGFEIRGRAVEDTSSAYTLQSNNAIQVMIDSGIIQLWDPSGLVKFPSLGTTASAANAFLDSGASNNLLRSTSSERYKRNIAPLSAAQADKVLDLAPIAYRSRAAADDPNRTFWGFTAEQAHEVLPALVTYDAQGAPDGFQYERVIVGLVSVVKRLAARVAVLEGL